MNTLAAIEPFAVYVTLIWVGLAAVGVMLYRISRKPLSRHEQQRREDEAYQNGFRRGYREGLQSEPRSLSQFAKERQS